MKRATNISTAQQPAPEAPPEDLRSMDEAIAMLKTTRPTFYRWLRSGRIKGYKVGRQWRFSRQDIERFFKGEQPRVESPVSPRPLIAELHAKLQALGGNGVKVGEGIENLVEMVFRVALKSRAIDVHLGPEFDGKAWRLAIRQSIDGVLHVMAAGDVRLAPAVAERLKMMAAMNLSEKRMPQDGRVRMSIDSKEYDIRIACLPAHMGESFTCRILHIENLIVDVNAMGYDRADLDRLTHTMRAPWGLILINGPTGAGKTTTAYGLLQLLSGPDRKIITIEDPVEYLLPWMTQVGINPQAGATFSRCLRSAMRSAANVIYVGEIRDREVAEVCCQAALTGHLVLTTLHAQDNARALRRMIDIGVPPFVVGDCVSLVLSQRLVRALCPQCSKPAKLTPDEQAVANEVAGDGGLDLGSLPRDFRQAVGCPKCAGTGYRGRIVVAETMPMSPAVVDALREGATADELRRAAIAHGMTTFAADALRKAAAGITTLREVRLVRLV